MEIIKKKVSGSKLRVEGLRRRTDEAGLNCLFKGCLGAKVGRGFSPRVDQAPGFLGVWRGARNRLRTAHIRGK